MREGKDLDSFGNDSKLSLSSKAECVTRSLCAPTTYQMKEAKGHPLHDDGNSLHYNHAWAQSCLRVLKAKRDV